MTVRRFVIITLLFCIGCGRGEPGTDTSSEEPRGSRATSARSDDSADGSTDDAESGTRYDSERTSDDPLEGFPATILNYEFVLQSESDFPDGDKVVRLKASVDKHKYAALVDRLEELLREKSKESGVGLLGLADPAERRTRGIVYFGPTSPPALTNAVNAAIADKKGCVVIVAKELTEQSWSETRSGRAASAPGGSKSMPIEWFWVSDQTAAPLRNAFRRACEMKLQPVVRTKSGKSPLPIVTPYVWSTERMMSKTVLMPGGPAGHIFSAGTGGGDLNLAYARNVYVKSLLRYRHWPDTKLTRPEDVFDVERVLLFMPCMMIAGEFLSSATLPIDISVPAEQVAAGSHIDFQPILP